MPPRAQKKPAAAKKPSPNPAAKPDPAPEAPAPAPAAEDVPAAPAPAPAAEEVTVVTTEAVEEKVMVEEVTAEEAAPEEEVEPEEEEVEPEEEEEEEEAEDGDGADLDEDVNKVEQEAGAAAVGAGDNQPSGQIFVGKLDKEAVEDGQIYVGRLDKEAVEDDLVKVFGVFGELQSVRIMRRPDTQKSKRFGFVRYVNSEHAKKALDELKDGGVQVLGKEIMVLASNKGDTLHLGNINKLWSKDTVMNKLKELGVDQIKDLVLPDVLKKEGKTKGFAYIEFGSHADALAAFRRLRKPDAVFGCERSARVAFWNSSPQENLSEVKSQEPQGGFLVKKYGELAEEPFKTNEKEVKSVYVEGLPESWDEGRVKEACNQYGEIEKVRLFKSKKKYFGFVDFTSHESAVACVKGLHEAQLGEGDIKVKANLTKKKEVSNRGKTRSKGVNGSPASKQESKPQPSKSNRPSKSQGKTTPGKRRDRRGVDTLTNERYERPSKKPRDTNYGSRHGNQTAYMAHPTAYAPRYALPAPSYQAHAPCYALPAPSYQAHAYARSSGSNRRHSDLEPHGGYLPAGRGAHYSQPSSGSGYTRAAVQPSYQGYPGYPGYEDPYGYPSSGAYAPRCGYY